MYCLFRWCIELNLLGLQVNINSDLFLQALAERLFFFRFSSSTLLKQDGFGSANSALIIFSVFEKIYLEIVGFYEKCEYLKLERTRILLRGYAQYLLHSNFIA